jgi:hypothetical protein
MENGKTTGDEQGQKCVRRKYSFLATICFFHSDKIVRAYPGNLSFGRRRFFCDSTFSLAIFRIFGHRKSLEKNY